MSDTQEEIVWLDFDTVMTRLKLKRPELYRQVKDGKIKAEKKDHALQFNEKAVEEFDTKRKSEYNTMLQAIVQFETLLTERFPIPVQEEPKPEETDEGVTPQATAEELKTEGQGSEEKPAETQSETAGTEGEEPKTEEPEAVVDLPARTKSMVEQLLKAGVREGITDLYIDPLASGDRVLFRYGEALIEIGRTEACLGEPLRKVLREMGKLVTEGDKIKRRGIADIAESEQTNQILIEIAPTRLGDHIHAHFWGADQVGELAQLGYSTEQADYLVQQLNGTSAMILVTRGVGAADDLHHVVLGRVISQSNLVVSCESGVFPKSEHLVQVAVDTTVEGDFVRALDTALGLEPDVLMVDLVSKPDDLKSLYSALSMGGVVVAGIRALDMDDARRLFTKAEIPVDELDKRLTCYIERASIRRLCPNCKEARELTQEELQYWDVEDTTKGFDAKGCEQCQNGFLDRRGIYEISGRGNEILFGAKDILRQCVLDGEVSPVDAKQVSIQFDTQP